MEDLHLRVAHLEKESHTMKYRVDAIESEKLPHRVTSLEAAIKEITGSIMRVESGVGEIKKDLAKQKIWVALIVAGGTGGAEMISFLQEFMK
jgi:hypothetical protein